MPIDERPPPPRPCSTRPKMSTSMLGASAQTSEPAMIDQDRDAQREPAAVDVGDLAVERDDGGRRQQVGGDQPRQAVDVAEVAADGRQRGRQDGLVERAHERRQQHAEHDQQRLTMGEGLGLTAVGVGVHWRSSGPGTTASARLLAQHELCSASRPAEAHRELVEERAPFGQRPPKHGPRQIRIGYEHLSPSRPGFRAQVKNSVLAGLSRRTTKFHREASRSRLQQYERELRKQRHQDQHDQHGQHERGGPPENVVDANAFVLQVIVDHEAGNAERRG